jgi:hypothetical protein
MNVHRHRRVGEDRGQAEAHARIGLGVDSDQGATVHRQRGDADHHERQKDHGDHGEEIPAPSSGPAPPVWPDIARIWIGVHPLTGLTLWCVGELRHSAPSRPSCVWSEGRSLGLSDSHRMGRGNRVLPEPRHRRGRLSDARLRLPSTAEEVRGAGRRRREYRGGHTRNTSSVTQIGSRLLFAMAQAFHHRSEIEGLKVRVRQRMTTD